MCANLFPNFTPIVCWYTVIQKISKQLCNVRSCSQISSDIALCILLHARYIIRGCSVSMQCRYSVSYSVTYEVAAHCQWLYKNCFSVFLCFNLSKMRGLAVMGPPQYAPPSASGDLNSHPELSAWRSSQMSVMRVVKLHTEFEVRRPSRSKDLADFWSRR